MRGINCVIDVGANRGQFGLLLRRLGYAGRIVSIEPASRAFAVLQAVSASDQAWLAVQMALGADPGEATLNVTAHDDLSSLRAVGSLAGVYFPEGSRVVGTEKVVVHTLDACLDGWVRGLVEPRVLLKIDTQGCDLDVLGGAENVLSRVEAVQIEVSFKPLYEGVPSWHRAVAWCEARGFALDGLFPVLRDPHGGLVEADALFVRIGNQRIAPGGAQLEG